MTSDTVAVTKSSEEKTTDGMWIISPKKIFSYNTWLAGYRPAIKNAIERIPKNFKGFTFNKINKSVWLILMPSWIGSSFVAEPLLRL